MTPRYRTAFFGYSGFVTAAAEKGKSAAQLTGSKGRKAVKGRMAGKSAREVPVPGVQKSEAA